MSFHGLMVHFILALEKIALSRCTTVYLFIHQLKDILIFFQVLAIMDKASINIPEKVFV